MNTAYLWVVVLATLGFSGALEKSCSFSPANYTYLEENVFIYFDEDSDTKILEYAMTFVNATGVENNTHLTRTRIFRTQQDGAFHLAVSYIFFDEVFRKFLIHPYTVVDVSLDVSPTDCFENITKSETEDLLINYFLKDFNITNHQLTPDIHICKTEVDEEGNINWLLLECCKQEDASYFTCYDVQKNLWIQLFSNIFFVMCAAYQVIYSIHQLERHSFTVCRLLPLHTIRNRDAENDNVGTADGSVQESMGQTFHIDLNARKSQLLPAGGSSFKATQFLLPEYLMFKAIRYTDYTSKILPSALVVIFYVYDTFRGVDQKYATFLDKLVKIIKEKIKTGELVCVQNENIELKNTMVQYAPAPVTEDQLKKLHSSQEVGKQIQYNQAYLLIVTDEMSFKYISKEFFFKCCLINCAGAPGGLIKNYGKATIYLILKLLFVAHVFVAMMLYGKIVETSPMGQWLLTLVSCLSPMITKLLVANATGSEKINTDYKRFEKKLMKTITKFSQKWDIEGRQKAKTVETDQYTLRQRGSERTALVSNAYESYN